jgi:hypothetical protein
MGVLAHIWTQLESMQLNTSSLQAFLRNKYGSKPFDFLCSIRTQVSPLAKYMDGIGIFPFM